MGLTKPRAAQIYDIDYKQATRTVTVANVTLAGGAPNQVDGINLTVNDRVLVTGQSDAKQNGLYYVENLGTGVNGTWLRTSDGNQTGEIEAGMIVMVTEGTAYADTQWKLITDNPIVIGVTELIFTQNYSANSISAGSSNVSVIANANVNISSNGTANVVAVSNTGAYVTGVVSATGNITGSYIFGNGSQLTGIVSSNELANTNSNVSNLSNALSNTNSNVSNVASNVTTLQGQVYSNANVAAYLPTYTGNLVALTGNVTTTANISGNYILGNGSQLTGLPESYGNANVAAYLPTYTGNISAGNVSTTGNITANFFIGNGSQLTGLSTSSIANGTSNVSILANSSIQMFAPSFNANLGAVNIVGSTDGNSVAPQNPGVIIHTTGTQDIPSRIYNDGVDNFAGFVGRRYDGTVNAPTQVLNNEIVSRFAGTPYSSNGWPATSTTRIDMVTTEDQTDTDRGTEIQFWATPTGSNVIAQVMSVTDQTLEVLGNVEAQYYIGDGSKLSGIAPTVQVYEFANTITTGGYYSATWLADYVAQPSPALVTTTVSTTPTLLGGFITATGYPGITTIPVGLITIAYETQKATGANAYRTYAEIYKYSSSNVETLLNTSDFSTTLAINTLVQQSVTDYVATPITLDVTDRILVKIYAVMTSGASRNITLRFDDNTNSGLQLPALPASIQNFIPYFGATANTNLGNFGLEGAYLSATGNITGNIISVTGNITGNYFIGNGSQLTGIPAGYANSNAVAYGEAGWAGNIIPAANATYSLGSPTAQWASVYIGNATMYLGTTGVSANNVSNTLLVNGVAVATTTSPGNINTAGAVSATGNITGSYFFGNGSQLTGIDAANITNAYSNANVANYLPTYSGNVTAGNVSVVGAISTANITIFGDLITGTGPTLTIDPNGSGGTDGNVVITGNLTVQGTTTTINSNTISTNDLTINMANNAANATAANNGGIEVGPVGAPYATLLYNTASNVWISSLGISSFGNVTALAITANGNLYGANITTAGLISATGNATAGNVLTGGLISATGNVTGGNVLTSGLISATSSITGAVISIPAGALTLTNQGSVNDIIAGTKNVGQVIIGGATQTGAITVGQSTATQSLSLASGVTSSGNTKTISIGQSGAAGSNTNITIGPSAGVGTVNIGSGTTMVIANTSGTALSVAGNITGANINTAGVVSATGNVQAGNIRTAGLISATGNITGNYFIGNGSQLTGVTAGNSFSPIVISGQSNVTANSSATALTYVAGYGIVINSDNTAKSITYSLDAFAIGGSFGVVDGIITSTMDLGLVTDAVTVSYDLGTVVSSTIDLTNVSSSIIPSANVTYDLGNATNQWRSIYVSGNTIYIGGGTISADNAGITMTSPGGAEFSVSGNSAANTVGNFGEVSASGNVTGNYILGDGSQLTGISSGNSSINITVTTISANTTIAAGQNGFSVGPMSTADGVQVSIADGQRWVII